MKKLLLTACVGFLFACSSETDFSFDAPNRSVRALRQHPPVLERIPLPDVETSGIGMTMVGDDKLYFADKKVQSVYEFDPANGSARKVLGFGRSKREFAGGINAIYYAGDDLFRIVSDCWLATFKRDSIGFLEQSHFFTLQKDESDSEIYAKADKYTYLYDKLRAREYNDTLYLSIAGNHPMMNMYIPGYFRKARIIEGIPLAKGKSNFVMGRLSPGLADQKGKRQFFMFDFDLDAEGNFYVTYELDSLIYKFDHDFRIVETFGNAGRDMDFTEHRTLVSSEFKAAYVSERKKAHYRSIRRVGDYTFRSYAKRTDAATDGLQIYFRNELIADIDTPRGMDLVGKIGDEYYSNLLSTDDDRLAGYRLKL